jgi:ribonucleotide monophosphatase NagD (HAD superfamily)
MATALVLTGISSVKDITTLKIQPDFVLKSIEEVLSI